MPFNPGRHHRRSIRLPGYDYTQPGYYFITICVHQRLRCLAHIDERGHQLSSIGELVATEWMRIPARFPAVKLDKWVVMPDHFHGILQLIGAHRDRDLSQPSNMRSGGTIPSSVPAMVQRFKSYTSRAFHQATGEQRPLWQRGYYERIVRDDDALNAIQRYIAANPSRST